jgi:hypothetical protein
MTDAPHDIGQVIKIQFVWRISDGDLLRAIFDAEVQKIDQLSEKFVVRLDNWLAGRQESSYGVMRSLEEVSRENWALVARLPGQRISLSFEASDGRPLWLRYETLTGEHNFFRRLNELPPVIKLKLADIPYIKGVQSGSDIEQNQ